jgi:hypothetical protein
MRGVWRAGRDRDISSCRDDGGARYHAQQVGRSGTYRQCQIFHKKFDHFELFVRGVSEPAAGRELLVYARVPRGITYTAPLVRREGLATTISQAQSIVMEIFYPLESKFVFGRRQGFVRAKIILSTGRAGFDNRAQSCSKVCSIVSKKISRCLYHRGVIESRIRRGWIESEPLG